MTDIIEHQEHQEGQDEDDQLQDTFITSFIIGVIIVAIWLWIFFIYLGRL